MMKTDQKYDDPKKWFIIILKIDEKIQIIFIFIFFDILVQKSADFVFLFTFSQQVSQFTSVTRCGVLPAKWRYFSPPGGQNFWVAGARQNRKRWLFFTLVIFIK